MTVNVIIKKFIMFLGRFQTFRKFFYWLSLPSEALVKQKDFGKNDFVACLTKDGYLLGVYDPKNNPTWKRMVVEDYEPKEKFVIKNLMRKSSVFIDVGAHVGFYTCLVGNSEARVKVLAFEPNKDNFKSLKTNTMINRLKNTKLNNCGLGNKRGVVQLIGEDAAGSIIKKAFKIAPIKKQLVIIDKLDNYSNEISNNDSVFTKIDVEGSEFEVLKGAKTILKEKNMDYLLIELIHTWDGGDNPFYYQTIKFLVDRGYVPTFLSMQKKGKDNVVLITDYSEKSGTFLFVNNSKMNIVNSMIKVI